MTSLFKQLLSNQSAQIGKDERILANVGLTLGFLVTALFSSTVFSAAPDLASQPLSASSAVVKPNLMFVFDTSKSMEKALANDTLDDYAQCKDATKNQGGYQITSAIVGPTTVKPSNPNTRLTFKATTTGFNVNDIVYLAIPGNPEYSGVYQIKVKNTTSNSCIPGTEVYTTTVTVNPPFKRFQSNPTVVNPDRYNQYSYNPGNPYADPPVAPTNGCAVPGALPANSGNTTSDLNLGGGFVVNAGGVTSIPSGSCYIRDRKDTNGCKVTSPEPANSGSTSSNYNLGGGMLENSGGITSTPSTSCYWYDPADTPVGTFVSCTNGTVGENSYEVDIASGAPAGPLTLTENAYVLYRQDDSRCYSNEPPLVAAKVQSLFYDPSVEYVPPPKPSAVGLGLASPANRLPSMTSAYTLNWTRVREDGTRLNASGDPITNANGTNCNVAGSNLLTCNNTYRAPDGSYDFKLWKEMVYCDTPEMPAAFTSIKLWHESSRCKRNTPANTSSSVNASPRYPYPYPARTDGGATSPSKTLLVTASALHQNGVPLLTSDNPVAGEFAFGETYNYAAPFYYDVEAIEYCDSAKLNNCVMANAPTGAFTYPAYVRYCKTTLQASDTTTSPNAAACQGTYTGSGGSDYRFARYGLFKKTEVKPGNSYHKYAGRTDCSGSIGAGGCSYDEEMTNMANWYAYYRTRMQLMKSAIGRTFNELDKPETPLRDESEDYRIGFITVEGYNTLGNYLPIKDFLAGTNGQKEEFYKSIYSRWPAGGTSLRDVLGTVGRIFAGEKPVSGFTAPSDDPMQHSCQQNFTLLTTDGYWNGPAGLKVDGSSINNQDATPTPFPKREGNVTTTGGSHTNTLADVAAYYYNTDIRNAIAFGPASCSGGPDKDGNINDVCDDNNIDTSKATQRMTTFTLGLGVDGQLNSVGYKTGGSVDFNGLKAGTVRWPSPGPDNGDTSFTQAERATVDDLWHAAINGAEDDKSQYFSAKNPQEVISGVRSALATLGDIKGTGSTTSLSNVSPTAGDNYAFSARYTTGSWTGNLFARTIDGFGILSANALWCVESESSVTPPCNPDATTGLAAKINADNRVVYFNNAGALSTFDYSLLGAKQVHFQAGNVSGLSQWATFNATQKAQAVGANLVNFLRGKNDFEESAPVTDDRLYRTRDRKLGDIIDSDPVFVGKSKYEFLDAGYSAFVTSTASRDRTVFVGANDGMLHAFNADTGEERWAYVPTAVMPNMWKLADTNYRNIHTNFVNAKMTVADIYVGGAWKTILVSGLGQGGKSYFALDITDPSAPALLWEFDSTTEPNLGFTYGKPVVTKKMDGNWVVLVTSGYNNTADGKGRLFVLDAATGTKLVGISTGEGSSTNPSGLAHISAFASNPTKNSQAQYVYGGDLFGNLYRFDIDDRASNPNANTVLKLTQFSIGGDPQPITVAPTLSEINGKRTVFVGTGKYIESSDLLPANYRQQSLYAFTDYGITSTLSGAALRALMEPQTISGGSGTRTSSGNSPDWVAKIGWYADLPSSASTGERENVEATIISGKLFVPTLIPPTGTCDVSGKAWTNIFDFKTGALTSSTESASPIAGLYFVFTNPTDDKVAVGTDFADGRPQNTDLTGLDAGGNTVYKPHREDLLGTNGAFVGNRAIWRELVE